MLKSWVWLPGPSAAASASSSTSLSESKDLFRFLGFSILLLSLALAPPGVSAFALLAFRSGLNSSSSSSHILVLQGTAESTVYFLLCGTIPNLRHFFLEAQPPAVSFDAYFVSQVDEVISPVGLRKEVSLPPAVPNAPLIFFPVSPQQRPHVILRLREHSCCTLQSFPLRNNIFFDSCNTRVAKYNFWDFNYISRPQYLEISYTANLHGCFSSLLAYDCPLRSKLYYRS